jgi:peroxiredoxin
LADYARLYKDFRAAGAEVVAISVDPPDRSAAMRSDLGIPFPLLSDSSRATITQWGVLNSGEKGGIAKPATFLIDRERIVRMAKVEDMMLRIEPREMLDFIRAGKASTASTPRARGVNPAFTFLRAMANGLRHGVTVKKE